MKRLQKLSCWKRMRAGLRACYSAMNKIGSKFQTLTRNSNNLGSWTTKTLKTTDYEPSPRLRKSVEPSCSKKNWRLNLIITLVRCSNTRSCNNKQLFNITMTRWYQSRASKQVVMTVTTALISRWRMASGNTTLKKKSSNAIEIRLVRPN